MKGIGYALAVGVLLGTAGLHAEGHAERCRVRVGHERPLGCAPYASKTVKVGARSGKSKRPDVAVPPDEAWLRTIRLPEDKASQKRSQRLLIQELDRLERLLRVTPKNSPERPGMIRRLAEGYAELEALAALDSLRAAAQAERAEQHRP